MGILIRKPDTILDTHLSDLDSDVTQKALSDSRKKPASLVEFLHERRLIIVNDYFEIECAKQRVEASGIVNMMVETCAAINRIAGGEHCRHAYFPFSGTDLLLFHLCG
jgi:hypothetical protein